jgi:hypothetical protein
LNCTQAALKDDIEKSTMILPLYFWRSRTAIVSGWLWRNLLDG